MDNATKEVVRNRPQAVAIATVGPGMLLDILGQLDLGVAVLTTEGIIELANSALTTLLDPSAEDNVDAWRNLLGTDIVELAQRPNFHHVEGLLSWPPDGVSHQVSLRDGRTLHSVWHQLGADGHDGSIALVVRDVTAQALIRQRLREHNRSLAEIVAAKTELVAALCHELRTPLTSITSMLELMPDLTNAPDAAGIIEVVDRNLRRISEVVTELATLSELEQGKINLTVEPVDVATLINDAVGAWNARQTNGAQLNAAVSGNGAIQGDPTWLAALIDRLLSVTVASALPDSIITVEALAGADGWLILVPLQEQLTSDRLFTTTGGARTSTALMLARAVVTRHGGTLRVATHDHRTEFELRLPYRAPTDLHA